VAFAHSFGIDYYEYPMPTFENVIEIVYLTEGEFTLTLGKTTHVAKKGDVVIFLYQEKMFLASHAYHHHETVSMNVRFCLSDGEDGDEADTDGLYVPLVVTDTSGHCQNLIEEIIRTHAMFPEQTMRCSGLCLELLSEISETARRNRLGKNTQGSPHIIRAKKYVHHHLSEPIRQRDIAAYLNITPEHLSTLFKNHEHCSVMSYIHRAKLNAVFSLMQNEGLPLYKAAALYGFNSPHYVSRLFKKYYDQSISEALERGKQARSERRIWDTEDEE
jgi:AraC-like DNA-binding protein